VVVGAAIVLILVIAMIVRAATSGGDEDKKAAPVSSKSPLPSLESPAPTVAVPDCTKADMEVEAEATDSTFASPAKPTFTVAVTNNGTLKCVIDPESVHIHVTSGEDRIFDSDDNCNVEVDPASDPGGNEPAGWETQSDEDLLAELDGDPAAQTESADAGPGLGSATPPNTGSEVVLLEPGATEAIPVSWSRERSAPSCEAYLLTTPGNGTYHAVFSVAGVESGDVVFALS
jgi:hypothetical protein